MLSETMIVFTGQCLVCGLDGRIEVPTTDYMAWRSATDCDPKRFVQNAMPTLSDGEREQILNGTHPECFDSMFADMEEEDDDGTTNY